MNDITAWSEPRSVRFRVSALVLAFSLSAVTYHLFVDPLRAFASLLTAAVFTLGLCLGGAIFVATQGAAGATWWHPIERVPLYLSRTLVVPALTLAFVFIGGLSILYPWAQPDVVAASALLQGKTGWLNVPFFFARAILVFLVWFGAIAALTRRPHSRKSSIVFLLVMAPTLSIAAWDFAMSLEPEWFSTMYGVYWFAGFFQAGIAAVAFLGLLLERSAVIPHFDEKRRHDIGKLLFGFSAFWAYIWFCQYMLIWYTNLPEEVTYYVLRHSSGWTLLFWLNPILNFVVPFVALMSVSAKKSRTTLFHVAAAVLVGRWLDSFLMVWPSVGPFPGFPVLAILTTAARIIAVALVFAKLAKTSAT